jgi:hypothetical protein
MISEETESQAESSADVSTKGNRVPAKIKEQPVPKQAAPKQASKAGELLKKKVGGYLKKKV